MMTTESTWPLRPQRIPPAALLTSEVARIRGAAAETVRYCERTRRDARRRVTKQVKRELADAPR